MPPPRYIPQRSRQQGSVPASARSHASTSAVATPSSSITRAKRKRGDSNGGTFHSLTDSAAVIGHRHTIDLSIVASKAGPSTALRGAASSMPTQSRYRSAFRPALLANALLRPSMEYVLFKFKKTICTVNESGIPSLAKVDVEDEIMVSKHWQQYKSSDEPMGGWLGGGSSKYAFEVCHRR